MEVNVDQPEDRQSPEGQIIQSNQYKQQPPKPNSQINISGASSNKDSIPPIHPAVRQLRSQRKNLSKRTSANTHNQNITDGSHTIQNNIREAIATTNVRICTSVVAMEVIELAQNGYPKNMRGEKEVKAEYEKMCAISTPFRTSVGDECTLLISILVAVFSTAVLGLQIAFFILKLFRQSGNQNKTDFIIDRKTDDMLQIVYNSTTSSSDLQVAQIFLTDQLSGLFPTVLDQLVLAILLCINLLLFQWNLNPVTYMLNIVLTVKDLGVIIYWIYFQYTESWHFTSGMADWGYLFLKRPMALPIVFAILNLFVLRLNYFRTSFATQHHQLESRRMLVKDLPSNLHLNTTHFTGLRSKRQFTAIAALYLAICGLLLIANVFSGIIIMILGCMGFFALFLIYHIFSYAHLRTLFKQSAKIEVQSYNLDLIIRAKCSETIQEREKQTELVLLKDMTFFVHKSVYAQLLCVALVIIFSTAYGTIWSDNGDIAALLRFLYSSPFQVTLNIMSYSGNSVELLVRWVAPL